MSGWHGETIDELRGALARGATTSERLTEQCLERIAALNPRLNAFITVTADAALAAARAADGPGPRGAPVGRAARHPDLAQGSHRPGGRAHHRRLAACAATSSPPPTRRSPRGSAPPARSIVGKTNLHEFAFGTTSDDSGFGGARHPDRRHAVARRIERRIGDRGATGMSIASIGTDTGGSIRIPAGGVRRRRPEARLGRDSGRRRGAAQPAARSRRAAGAHGHRRVADPRDAGRPGAGGRRDASSRRALTGAAARAARGYF